MNPAPPVRLSAVVAALALAACGGPGAARRDATPAGTPTGLDAGAARAVLVRFATLAEAGDFERALPLLSPRWRARASPGRLARDHAGAGIVAREALARARRDGPSAPVALEPGRARIVLGEGREAVLVAEEGGWRVDALE